MEHGRLGLVYAQVSHADGGLMHDKLVFRLRTLCAMNVEPTSGYHLVHEMLVLQTVITMRKKLPGIESSSAVSAVSVVY